MENNTAAQYETTDYVTVSAKLDKAQRKKLVWVCYDKAKETYKKGAHIDWFIKICGIFAIICLGVCIYNVARYGIDTVFALMMTGYVIVAAVCLIKPAHYGFLRLLWKVNFASRLVLRGEDATADFAIDSVSFAGRKGKKTIKYEKFWDAYETEECYVFHYDDNNLLAVSKNSVAAVEEEYENEDLKAYFTELVTKAHRSEE